VDRSGNAPPGGTDTIAAIATSAGIGGVGIIRASGPRAIEIVADVVGGALDRRVRVAWARGRDGARIDQVIAFAMPGPASFTGEDVAELHGHGGSQNLKALLAAVVERGARIAEPGEFTRRAVEHGKLDLVRAEALLDVIHAGSERALRLAQANLAGQLGDAIAALERDAHGALAEIEGRIDFPDDDLGAEDARAIEATLVELEHRAARMVERWAHGAAVMHGLAVALVGPVNVGKSSLLNALVGKERALVAEAPGTTRDYLEASDVWDGVAVTLIDTAGTRATSDPIEARGIALGEAHVAARAEIVVVVNDGVAPWDDGARYGTSALVVRSKVDLGGEARGAHATSATTGLGIAELKQQILARAGVAQREGNEDAFITTARQAELVTRARDGFGAAATAWRGRQVPEVVALELRQGVQALAQVRGVEVGERVLDEVFARFCIGK
jgi:tRNA modification GTPase